ncbi:hypothetical protein OU798_10055 [Prolixibacteraceae bacterium Z1-6]|uniref:DUF4253 domain-containing protein n=1 Tax=Draconibacterium aestuarii TaxID=2998507 RepID=A0A9X3J679_9BACT|nr:hypothetical protein [Prolixibacteraceae bacterium Z1-6]
MKKFILLLALCLCGVSFLTNNTRAQEAEKPTLFLVMEEFVAPADMAQFRKVQSHALEVFDQLELGFKFATYQTNQNSFYWAMPLTSFASIDELFVKMTENHKAFEEIGYSPEDEFRDLSTISQFVVRWNEELSNPDKDADNEEDDGFYEWTFMHLKSGHEKEATEATKKYLEFYQSIEENFPWDIYEVVLGDKTPCWILETSAKNEATLRQLESELNEKYGKDFQKLWQNFVQHVNTLETKKGWYLPGWSRFGDE